MKNNNTGQVLSDTTQNDTLAFRYLVESLIEKYRGESFTLAKLNFIRKLEGKSMYTRNQQSILISLLKKKKEIKISYKKNTLGNLETVFKVQKSNNLQEGTTNII